MRPDLAPGHVARIKELVRDGFYDGIVFHRVIDGFMAQTGCPQGTGTGGSGKKLKAEFNREPHRRGTVSMARAQSPGFRRQPVLHLLCRRAVPQRPIHGLGSGDRGHGERRQDQARRAGAKSRPHRLGEDGRERLISMRRRATSIDLLTPPRADADATQGRARTPSSLANHSCCGAADRTIDPCEEYRRGAKALAIGNDPSCDIPSRLWASHHDGAHSASPCFACCFVFRLRSEIADGVRRLFDAKATTSRRKR